MSIVEQAQKATAKRTTYGIEIRVGNLTFNEWGLHETQAKEVNDLLTAGNDQPIEVVADDGSKVIFTRRKPSDLSAMLAAAKAKQAPVTV